MMPANHDRLSLAQLRGLAPLPPKKLTEKEWVEKEMEAMTRGDVAGTCSICMEELGERFRGAKDEAGREERKTSQGARSERRGSARGAKRRRLRYSFSTISRYHRVLLLLCDSLLSSLYGMSMSKANNFVRKTSLLLTQLSRSLCSPHCQRWHE